MKRHPPLFGFRAAFLFGAALAMASSVTAAEDIFAVSGVKVEATGASATQARDAAIAQGRPVAWTRLYRRLTRERDWPRQPRLDDDTLLRMIRAFEIANEKRSSTRYLAEITYAFRAAEVRRLLQQAGISYTESSARPVLVVPIIAGAAQPFDPAGAWTQAWATGDMDQGLLRLQLPSADAADMAVLSRADLAEAQWSAFAPLTVRYGASEVLIAKATPGAGAVRVELVRVGPSGSQTMPLAAPQANYAAAAQAAAESLREAWKGRSAVNYGQRSKLTALVAFSSGQEWNAIRGRLAQVPSIVNVDVAGLTVKNAAIELSYVGQLSQLQDALAQQNLLLAAGEGHYSLRTRSAAPNP